MKYGKWHDFNLALIISVMGQSSIVETSQPDLGKKTLAELI